MKLNELRQLIREEISNMSKELIVGYNERYGRFEYAKWEGKKYRRIDDINKLLPLELPDDLDKALQLIGKFKEAGIKLDTYEVEYD
jgi:hypothetical protein